MSITYKSLPFLLLLTLMGCNSNFTDWVEDNWIVEEEVCDDDTTSVTFKKVAYWSPKYDDDGDREDDDFDEIDFSALTHVLYASITIDSDGNLYSPDDTDTLEDLIEYGHDEDVEVGISIGVWSDDNDTYFNAIASDSDTLDDFVDNVIDFLDFYDLDGVDINWQSIDDDDESDDLEELLDELEEQLSDEGYFLSMTVPSGEDDSLADNINNDMFDYVDFVNIIAFDPSDNSSYFYSTLDDAEEAVTYWTGRCLIQNKLVLGVPFYSVGDAVRSFEYIVEDDIDYACVDESEGRYYNGIPTIIDKTSYALLYAGGIMMKSLEQDYVEDTDYSLLNAINETSVGEYVDICD